MFGLDSLVPVTMFNKGHASKIFDRVKAVGQLVVLKNNTPEAVIISTDEYARLTEIEENYYLLLEANERMSRYESTKSLSEAEIMERLGITQSQIDAADDVETRISAGSSGRFGKAQQEHISAGDSGGQKSSCEPFAAVTRRIWQTAGQQRRQ